MLLRELTDEEYSPMIQRIAEEMAAGFAAFQASNSDAMQAQAHAHVKQIVDHARSSQTQCCLAIEVEGDTVGEVWYRLHDDALLAHSAHITWICIADAYQQQGYAKQAMQLLEQQLAQEGIKQCLLEVFLSNQTALHLYQEMGYTPVRQVLHKFL